MACLADASQLEQLIEKVDSKFTLVSLAAKRARQINSYFSQLGEGLGTIVPPQVTSFSCKPLTISLEEIAAGKIVYERPEVVERLSPKSRQPRSESRRSTVR